MKVASNGGVNSVIRSGTTVGRRMMSRTSFSRGGQRFSRPSDFFKDFETGRSPKIFLWVAVAVCQVGFDCTDQFASGLKAAFANYVRRELFEKSLNET